MITFDVATNNRDGLRRLADRIDRAGARAAGKTAEQAAAEIAATVERETTLRRGVMATAIDTRPAGRGTALVAAVRRALTLSQWDVRQVADGVLVDARVGRGPQIYRGARIGDNGEVTLAFGARRQPVLGPYTDWLFADVLELPRFRQWLRDTFRRNVAQEVDNAQS